MHQLRSSAMATAFLEERSFQESPQEQQKEQLETEELKEGEKLEETFVSEDVEEYRLDFISKSGDEIRNNFLRKLTYNKVWLTPSEKPKTHQSVIIFDWDDTLLCTSFLNPTGMMEDIILPTSAKLQIKYLENAVVSKFTHLIRAGQGP